MICELILIVNLGFAKHITLASTILWSDMLRIFSTNASHDVLAKFITTKYKIHLTSTPTFGGNSGRLRFFERKFLI